MRGAFSACFPHHPMPALLREISTNWKSGLTVALVSLPLSLSLAIASNATPVMGIITAVWAGFIAAIFGGSRYNVVGPAGALSGILTTYALLLGVEILPILAILSGVAILVFWALRWDKYLVFIPSSVMHGFTLGVALIIGLNQINFALGLKGLPAHESLVMNIMESLRHAGEAHLPTIGLFLGTLLLLFLILKFIPKVPGPIIAAILGIGIGYLSDTGVLSLGIMTLFSKYGGLKATLIQVPSFALPPLNATLFKAVITISIVAVLETLLSAKIADGMTKTRFDQKKEMFGLGLSNIVSGLAGGLPATGVLARTALNIKMGATSYMSAAINALSILVIALILFPVFQYLPLAVVAGILVFVAIRMIEVHHFKKLFHYDKVMWGLGLTVAALTVAIDPIVGLLAGAAVALLIFVHHLQTGRSDITLHRAKKVLARTTHRGIHAHEDHGDVSVYRFTGELTYFNADSHERSIKHLKSRTIVLSLRNLFYIDIDGLEALHAIIEDCKKHGTDVYLSAASPHNEHMLEKAPWFRALKKEKKIFESTTAALNEIGFLKR